VQGRITWRCREGSVGVQGRISLRAGKDQLRVQRRLSLGCWEGLVGV
jgi:hypothetical protein